jgi:hypothetical protein
LRNALRTMDPPSPSSTISSASASDEVRPAVILPDCPLPPKPSIDSPTWYRDMKFYAEALRAGIEADRQARASQGIHSIETQCNIPGLQFPSDLWDQPGDGEFTKAEKKQKRTQYLEDLGIEPEAWMFPRVTVRRGNNSFGRK